MTMDKTDEATDIIQDLAVGKRTRIDRLAELVYTELRDIAAKLLRHRPADHVLQPTALVHEAFLRLADQRRVDWKGRSHFLAVGAKAMRRIVVDHARHCARQKRGGGQHRVALSDDVVLDRHSNSDVLLVEAALEKLAALNMDHCKLVELRFYAGMSIDEVAEALNMSKRTVERQWTAVRAWLRRELCRGNDT
jgi:RNA polymerase sigma factor (TIGR02999 family)